MGPLIARFLAQKLWRGEQYFMQIDSHSSMATHWDAKVQLIKVASLLLVCP
jgi:hypothetical protein